MIRRKQLITHDPENGKWGDCYRTCVSIILDIEPQHIPHFCDGPNGFGEDGSGIKGLREWLRPMGMGVWQNIYTADTSLEDILRTSEHLSNGVPYILTGKGGRGVNHCVVVIDGKVFCDPFDGTDNSNPFLGPAETPETDERYWWVEVIAKLPLEGAT